jgi:hypothetical protein
LQATRHVASIQVQGRKQQDERHAVLVQCASQHHGGDDRRESEEGDGGGQAVVTDSPNGAQGEPATELLCACMKQRGIVFKIYVALLIFIVTIPK